ncbi:MAG: glycoside hydrolase N-terminal domain-containing protein [Lachnospiraceae bacterium]|nr:glycoside hydrolase N-terminal domain-containing protein [Lachnospiraceae bacterium]
MSAGMSKGVPLLHAADNLCIWDMNNDKLWYKKPASEWKEGLPIGTGRLAAMLLGNPDTERIALNHEWVTTGYHRTRVNPDRSEYLPKVRELLKEEKYDLASDLANEAWGGDGGISGRPSKEDAYKPVGDLYFKIPHGEVNNYYRELDLTNAQARVSYNADGKSFSYRYIAQLVKDVIVVKIEAGGDSFDADFWYDRPLEDDIHLVREVYKGDEDYKISDGSSMRTDEGADISDKKSIEIEVDGKAVSGRVLKNLKAAATLAFTGVYTGEGGMTFSSLTAIRTDGEIELKTVDIKKRLDISDIEKGIEFPDLTVPGVSVKNAKEITLFINIGTDIKEGISSFEECELESECPSYEELFEENTEEYKSHYGRLSFELVSENNPYEALPTDERVKAYRGFGESSDNPAIKAGLIDATDNYEKDDEKSEKIAIDDATMPLLYFNYGRYLLCASSARGETPANLQGKWDEDIYAPWDCDYHNDINIQMNYWLAESGHLQEYMGAFFTYLWKLAENGRDAAKKLFGCRGIWIPLSSDLWAGATPETYGWSVWCSAAAWFAQHVWWHYEYSQSEEFLRNEGYPFLKDVALFYEDFLCKDENGVYQIMPSQSPENHFEGSGEMPVSICTSSTVDVEFAMEALDHAIKAAKVLKVDEDKIQIWEELKDNLPELKIGSKGQLLEWNKEFEESEPFHRHVSHLIGLYPGEIIDKDKTPELFDAAKRSLELRIEAGGGYTGWSRAWTSCIYARMKDSDSAWEHLRSLIGDYATESLLDLHPPRIFQIDGNFGGTAAILEMLIQSYYEEVDILPALPSLWDAGKITGLRARGGYVLDITWKNHELDEASLVSVKDKTVYLKKPSSGSYEVFLDGKAVELTAVDERKCVTFEAKKDTKYIIRKVK